MAGGVTSLHSQRSALSEINVTPLVDVMLVLLVIFMITVPVIQSGVQVDLPRTHNSQALTQVWATVTVDRNSNIYIGDQLTNLRTIATDLKRHLPDPSQHDIYVRADEHLQWGTLAKVMDAIKSGGISSVKLVTEPYDEPPAAAK